MLAMNGALADMIAAGARVLEQSAAPCIGMGQSPNSKGISLRTLTATLRAVPVRQTGRSIWSARRPRAVSALAGIDRPQNAGRGSPHRAAGAFPQLTTTWLRHRLLRQRMDSVERFSPAPTSRSSGHWPAGRNHRRQGAAKALATILRPTIMPAGAKILPYRSNIPYLSNFCFGVCDKEFPARCREYGPSVVVGGQNYGQGSSREHAALVPLLPGGQSRSGQELLPASIAPTSPTPASCRWFSKMRLTMTKSIKWTSWS